MSEVLIVGGLTIDRFVNGREAPGGSVLHSGLTAVAEGATVTTLTVAGDEVVARDGVARLASLGELALQPAPTTTTYRHEERAGVRVLIFEARTDQLDPARLPRMSSPAVALVAPIADEMAPSYVVALRAAVTPMRTVLLIQGWLRRLVIGEEVRALPLSQLSEAQRSAIASADAVVVSTEDLVESPGDPFGQATQLRGLCGPRPIIVVTLGQEGYVLDDPVRDRVVASIPRRVVTGVPAVGAGDAFGASLAVNLARGDDATRAADRATERVITILEARRG